MLKLKLQTFLNGRVATAMGLGLSRLLPPPIGYPVARLIADFFASRRSSPVVQAVRANQWVVQNEQIDGARLDSLVRETFRSSARSMYEFWHYFKDPDAVLRMVELDPSMERFVEEARQEKTGSLLVAPHVSAFDLVGRALALRGLKMHILSYPQPPGGYKWQNHLREIPGVLITPMSIHALRRASETLRKGWTVVTGVDRPLPTGDDAKYRARFFGRPAAMPVFYTRLALKTNLPVTVAGVCRKTDGRYRVWASEPIHLRRSGDLMEETVENTETILKAVADVIRRAPEQWVMFYPVWPEVVNQLPA